ncbi:MAG: CDP-diacylglycerol--glycerol-3-phosphate 3-phosphatidyltransferase [Verrucomicrobia bacterium]|nr:CDP-diacylglycerol--glycerol-3-phosphate 3-phosphatidyltransferase [Verrucomicrobiota bacterium]MBI3868089.1 CDP-diacylglycerol--glycerol-3-phosphate 3-phosphatidyltransferase [Verrucomicrobiota bacterium]
MNLPNKLTTSRFVLTALFLIALFVKFPMNETVALALFVLASVTDWLDGAIARQRKLITSFGILMDPLADKILTCSAFIAFVGTRQIAAWMVVIIVSRELAITGLRLLAASKNQVLAAEGFGKHKTISQITAIIAILVEAGYPQWGPVGQALFGAPVFGQPWVAVFVEVSKVSAVALTLLSGGIYLWRNRGLYLSEN